MVLALHVGFNVLDFDSLFLHSQFHNAEGAHIQVGYEHQGKPCDEVSEPPVVKQVVPRKRQEKRGNIVTETVFASKEIEELSFRERGRRFALVLAVIARLPENFFVCDRPGDTRHGDREQKQVHHLYAERLHRNLDSDYSTLFVPVIDGGSSPDSANWQFMHRFVNMLGPAHVLERKYGLPQRGHGKNWNPRRTSSSPTTKTAMT